MEVIDFHTHYVRKDVLNPTWLDFLESINPEFYARIDDFSSDPELFAAYLKSQGIKYAVVLSECAPATSGFVTTEEVIEFCRHQEMLFPFTSINPNLHPDPSAKLEVQVKEGGVKGLKLHPSYQFFYPNEARLYPLYAKAQALGIPALFHIGTSIFKGTRLKYCDPIYLDDVAVDFPELRIIMAHSGRGFWYDDCFALSRLHKNVYMDITGLPPRNLLSYFPELEKVSEKIIFGSDWPTMPGTIEKNVEAIKSLPLRDRTIEGILYKNAFRILFG
ncbi:MAG: metal-dependent hydrolase [Deltaproteobacteria bacterium RBG_13_47_9]|nr:MAG: metal-dependent hydrolase [Deltaproteobacteria bacterium RBG_13_47_9]